MRFPALLLLLILCAASTIASVQSSKPWFCHDLDCPEYTVVDKNDDYEVREYSKGIYVLSLDAEGVRSCTFISSYATLLDINLLWAYREVGFDPYRWVPIFCIRRARIQGMRCWSTG